MNFCVETRDVSSFVARRISLLGGGEVRERGRREGGGGERGKERLMIGDARHPDPPKK